MLPMISTRLLKVLRVKVGKASTERTGHLGAPALILTIHVSEHKGELAHHLQGGPRGTD